MEHSTTETGATNSVGAIKQESHTCAIPVVGSKFQGHPALEIKKEEAEERGDEDDDSELCDDDDLMEDLEAVFCQDFDLKGNFYHSETLSLAPNPCLHVEGVGSVGLPLAPRDAELLIKSSSEAPFGQGTQLAVNPDVRHNGIWEIEPHKIQILNAEWASFIKNTVVKIVQSNLGVKAGASQPRCELSKLLLYETGSHFPPHQDTEKAPGMFATVIIVLPSLFSGGEVHVSHGSKKHVIDTSAHSMTATSVLAWYTGVTHEAKLITSGFRLALSYNLIHTSPDVPRPLIPTEGQQVQQLRRVLRRWQEKRYSELPEENRIAYILNHRYSAQDLKNGLQALNRQDALLVGQLKTIADELGFYIFLGSLTYSQTGIADGGDFIPRYRKRRRYQYDYYDYNDEFEDESVNADEVVMEEVLSTAIAVDDLVHIDAESMFLDGPGIELAEDCLIQTDPFEDVDPDEKEYEGHAGSYLGNLEQYYYRSIVLVVDGSDDSILRDAGASYRVAKLSKSDLDNPTPQDRQKAHSIASSLKVFDNRDSALFLANLSFKWSDVTLWKTVMMKCCASGPDLDLDFECIANALTLFGFENVKPCVDAKLKATSDLEDRIDFIQRLLGSTASEANTDNGVWGEQCYEQAVMALEVPTTKEIPALMSVARGKGLAYLAKTFLNRLAKVQQPDFNFLVGFTQALYDTRDSLPQSPTSSGDLNEVLWFTLKLLIRQCNTKVTPSVSAGYYGVYPYSGQDFQTKIQKVTKIVELCSSIGHLDRAQPLLARLINIDGDKSTLFAQFYSPLIAQLRPFMVRCGIDLASTNPFSTFLRILVELYLHQVLAGPGPTTRTEARKIGCGCADCDTVDRFVTNERIQYQLFRMAKPRRLHVESYLARSPDLISYSVVTSGSPHGVNVVKRETLAATQTWDHKVSEAKSFLRNLGDDAAIHGLMGVRFEDVKAAIQGVKAYQLDKAHQEAVDAFVRTPAPGTANVSNDPVTTPSSSVATTSTGQKRKHPESNPAV